LESFLKPYRTSDDSSADRGSHVDSCKERNTTDDPDKFCLFDINTIHNNCTKELNFGYQRGDPCVLIKLNRIYNWEPKAYSPDELNDVPESVKNGYTPNMIYITCEGENAADKENIGPVRYYPTQGIEFKYFPFRNQPGYLSPFVFVHFMKPSPGVLINIECKAWAKNIKHDRMDREGSVHFELLIDGF